MRSACLLATLLVLPGCLHTQVAPESRPAVALEAETLDHRPATVGGPGPVRIVDVWATWCGPCRRASERLESFLAHHGDVALISLSVDDDLEALARYTRAHPVADLRHYPGGMERARREGLAGIPMFLVLDRRGRLVTRIVGLDDALERTLDDAIDDASR